MLAEYLSMLAEYYIEYPLIAAFDTATERTNRHRIVNLAIDYITKNLSHKISVADMAVYCMCSKSTLNHLFSAVMGRTIPEFVSIQRVNRAKYMIMNTSLGIEQIGTQCGIFQRRIQEDIRTDSDRIPRAYAGQVEGGCLGNIVNPLAEKLKLFA